MAKIKKGNVTRRTLLKAGGDAASRGCGPRRTGAGAAEIADQNSRFHDQRRRRQGRAGRPARVLLPRERARHRRHHGRISQGFPEDQHQLCAGADRRALQQDPVRTLRRPFRRRRHPTVRSGAGGRFPEEGRLRTLPFSGNAGLQGRPSEFAGRLVSSGPASTPPASPTTRPRSPPRTRRRPGRTFSIRAGRARSAARSPPPVCSSCSGTRCASSMAPASGRSSPSRIRTPSIPASSCSTGSPRATT